MALINVGDEDSWLKDYEYLGSLVSEINQATVRRRQLQINNLEHAHLTSQLRKQIPQAERQLSTLLIALEGASTSASHSIVPGEKERRLRLCETLRSALRKASDEFHRGPAHQGPFTKVADLGTLNWGEDESEATRVYSNSDLRTQHQHIRESQDAALESISVVVGNQKHIAKSIQTEVDDQDDMLIDIKEKMSNNQTNLEQQTANVVEATRKASTCGYWILILVLLIAIIIVSVW